MMCVMFHNDNPVQENEFDLMKQEYTNVNLYKVNTLLSADIRERHSDGSTKPYFKFYKGGHQVADVKYSEWPQQEVELRAYLNKQDGQDHKTVAVMAQQRPESDLKVAEMLA